MDATADGVGKSQWRCSGMSGSTHSWSVLASSPRESGLAAFLAHFLSTNRPAHFRNVFPLIHAADTQRSTRQPKAWLCQLVLHAVSCRTRIPGLGKAFGRPEACFHRELRCRGGNWRHKFSFNDFCKRKRNLLASSTNDTAETRRRGFPESLVKGGQYKKALRGSLGPLAPITEAMSRKMRDRHFASPQGRRGLDEFLPGRTHFERFLSCCVSLAVFFFKSLLSVQRTDAPFANRDTMLVEARWACSDLTREVFERFTQKSVPLHALSVEREYTVVRQAERLENRVPDKCFLA